jgi:NAD+ synthase (glutamine-hydrolysing)
LFLLKKSFSIVLAQLNCTVGDISGNTAHIIDACTRAREALDCKLIVFPELALTGYPPEDLLLRNDFMLEVEKGLEKVSGKIEGITAVIGHPFRCERALYNAASVFSEGQIIARYCKRELPNYSVFDEKRYFSPGNKPCVVEINGVRLGITICEDIWHDGPVEESAAAGANLVINLNASPFHMDKASERETQVVAHRARRNCLPIAYVNLVGGQDELVFDGGSFVSDNRGTITHRARYFEEQLVWVNFDDQFCPAQGSVSKIPYLEESVYQALVTGVRDYVQKNDFPGVVVGLSGGVDSALTLAIAVDALGVDNVQAILMPSRYTREISNEDAIAQVEALGVAHRIVDIEPLFEVFLQQLAPLFEGFQPDSTEENIQARIRGTLLMAISNKTGAMVLTTGNKSEMAVGYATLYGDMAGGFSAIKDVPKTLVYRLARYRNEKSKIIPERVLNRAPSAELTPDQEDQDTLPSYAVLDAILEAYIERDEAVTDIIKGGFDADAVIDVIGRVKRNEYKRRQAAPGVRISRRAFGRDRRYPITSAFE